MPPTAPGLTVDGDPPLDQGERLDDPNPVPADPPSDWRTVPLPFRMRGLPRDHRGYPIFFAISPTMRPPEGARVDFRVLNVEHHLYAHRNRLCAICGRTMGPKLWLIGGPMCVLNRVFGDGPMHEECARYAMKVCPYLTISQKNFSMRPLEETDTLKDVNVILKKPARCVLITVRDTHMIPAPGGKPLLIVPPEMVAEWYTPEAHYLCRTRPNLFAQ
jgi:hypothetical protein